MSNQNSNKKSAFVNQDRSDIYSILHLSKEELQNNTAVYSLENGGKSLAARLWLISHAKQSIDIQYFSFSRNVTGLIASKYVVDAADRGVMVRLLIDEAAGKLNRYEIKMLDAHENIEVKLYNAGLKLGRVDKKLSKLISNYNRLQRRMHNKTFVIDGQAAITGGRNISDEYFDFGEKYNFRDRCVLLVGKAAVSAKTSFNMFWNSELSVKAEDLIGKSKSPFDVGELFERVNKIANDTVSYAPALRKYVKAFPSEIVEARKAKEFLIIEPVCFISDVPGKNEDRGRKGGITTDSIISLIRSAKHTLDIQSPYFITTQEGKELLRETVARGVKVRVLTNSMSSIDNEEAFAAYKKDRKENLANGIELYEFRPNAAVRFTLMIPDVQEKDQYKAAMGLHSKTMIIDGKISVIGSYNLDPRSANYNTECIAIIRSPEFSKNLSEYVEKEYLPVNAWRITNQFNPDKEAGIKKRIKTSIKSIYPKKLL